MSHTRTYLHADLQDAATKAKLEALTQEIKTLQTEIEQLGEQGEVEKAEEANKKVSYARVCIYILHTHTFDMCLHMLLEKAGEASKRSSICVCIYVLCFDVCLHV